MNKLHAFHCQSPEAPANISNVLSSCLARRQHASDAFVLLCIGSDRVTGDSLGPLTGYKLAQKHLPNLYVYGTLENPVHALNLAYVLTDIKKKHPSLPIVAVDASFGDLSVLNCVTVCAEALKPGIGVNKELGAVGDIAVTGVVSADATQSFAQLAAARLHTVMRLSDVIAEAVAQTAATFC